MDQKTIDQIQTPSHRDEIAVPNVFRVNDGHSSRFAAVVVHHILQKGLLELGSITSLILRIDIHRLVPHPK